MGGERAMTITTARLCRTWVIAKDICGNMRSSKTRGEECGVEDAEFL